MLLISLIRAAARYDLSRDAAARTGVLFAMRAAGYDLGRASAVVHALVQRLEREQRAAALRSAKPANDVRPPRSPQALRRYLRDAAEARIRTLNRVLVG